MKQAQREEIFGKFEYEDLPNGGITILGDWIKKHIVKIRINNKPLWIHHDILPQIHMICEELKEHGLLHYFDLSNGGGGFVPRHKCWKTTRGLSCHSWGIAIDLNPKKYPYGTSKNPPKKVIAIFKKYGFIHGGSWRSLDQMHFEWRRFV